MARPSLRGFTLIELLIVIAIIGILMALLFPAFGSALNMARKTAAKNDVVQIANALVAYQAEYGQWPNTTNETNVNMGGTLLDILTAGTTANATNFNPRKINFIEVGDAKKGKSGRVPAGTLYNFVDPWGQPYQVEMDANYDNTLTNLPGVTNTAGLRKTVAVWSIGIPKVGSYTNSSGYQSNANTTNFIKSWE